MTMMTMATTPRRIFAVLAVSALGAFIAVPAAAQEVTVAHLTYERPAPRPHEITLPPVDEGTAGSALAVADNNSGRTAAGPSFNLEAVTLGETDAAADAARRLADEGVRILVVDLSADRLLEVADALAGRDVLIFNAGAGDDRLRGADCRKNVFHVAPSRAMLADAVAQFLAARRWRKVFLLTGPEPADQLYVEAVRRAAKKFSLQITAEKPWDLGPLARTRADSPTTAEALVLTRGLDADVIWVADEAGDFGDYLLYHTADPKLVVGTQGLAASTWHRAHDYWGAPQLHSRFIRRAGRPMRPLDYQAWTAVRAIGEAVVRTGSADPRQLAAYLAGSEFDLAAFKGLGLSFRPWDRQLRQPLLLAQPAAVVSVSPQPGYLHQRTVLDTLGADQPESQCKAP
jgi:ABC transporter substrate binding protein (PQQ-dependent alcohol dehydrogenase system)